MRIALLLGVWLAWAPARAANLAPLRADLPVDLSLTAGGGALWLGSELLFKGALAPSRCRWCDADAAGRDTLDGFDRTLRDALRWKNPATADALSNVGAFGLVPLVALGGVALAGHRDGAELSTVGTDLLVIAEAAVLAQDLNQAVKFAAGRERPFVHAMDPAEKSLTAHPDDNNLSFFSGHTTWVFALATAAGTVSAMHGYRATPWIWAGGLTLATAVGVLRVGADKHYATDVLMGALVGTAFGVGVPLLFHRPPPAGRAPMPGAGQALAMSLSPERGGLSMSVGGHF